MHSFWQFWIGQRKGEYEYECASFVPHFYWTGGLLSLLDTKLSHLSHIYDKLWSGTKLMNMTNEYLQGDVLKTTR